MTFMFLWPFWPDPLPLASPSVVIQIMSTDLADLQLALMMALKKVSLKIATLVGSIIAQLTSKGLFTRVYTEMFFHLTGLIEDFTTEAASMFAWSKSYEVIIGHCLQNQHDVTFSHARSCWPFCWRLYCKSCNERVFHWYDREQCELLNCHFGLLCKGISGKHMVFHPCEYKSVFWPCLAC